MGLNNNNAANYPVGVQLGASGTTSQGLGQNGALRNILTQTSGSGANADNAIAFANQFSPLAPKADPWEAAFQFFAEMGKQASVPGSTALGAAASSLQAPMDYLNAKKKERRDSEAARTQMALTIGADLEGDAGTIYKVQSSKILDGNVTITVFSDGRREVRGPNGDIVTGETAFKVIKEAEDRGIDIQKYRAGGRRAAVVAVNTSLTAFDQVLKSRSNIANLTEAKRLIIEEGANTGFIVNNLPNWKDSSIALNTVKNELGLDVVGSVTFGALSQGELTLALNTALPTNLSEDALVDWIDRKISAQGKLQDYLYAQATYLADGDKTIGDWLRSQEKKQKEKDLEKAERRQSGTNFDFTTMEAAELQEINLDTLTGDQVDAWSKRMTELGL